MTFLQRWRTSGNHTNHVPLATPDALDARTRLPSTQERLVALSAVRQDVLCLRDGVGHAAAHGRWRRPPRSHGDPANTLYRAVLVTTSVNFSLKSAREQEVLLAGYRTFLNGLSFPVQLLVRVVPLDLDPYLARLFTIGHSDNAPTSTQGSAQQLATDGSAALYAHRHTRHTLRDLASDHATFVRHLAQRHTLLERRFYIVIPADGSTTFTGSGTTSPDTSDSNCGYLSRGLYGLLLPSARRAHAAAAARAHFGAIAQQLDLRAGEITRSLARFGVDAQRLAGHQLVELYYSCLSPSTAVHHPLSPDVLDAAHMPVQRTAMRVADRHEPVNAVAATVPALSTTVP